MNVVKSKSFNPYQYSTSNGRTEEPTNISMEEGDYEEIVSEGEKKMFKVDIAHFDKLCKKFRDKSDIRIKNLQGNDRKEFNLMVSYVHLLYGTNYYKHLHDRVKKYFSDLNKVRPGTIGGYFGGCLVSNSFEDQPGCSLTCAGAVPRPKDEEGWSFCDKAVIFAEKGKSGYNFSMLKESENSEENYNNESCYVFVEHTDLHDFKGFSRSEKEKLKNMGAKNIHLIGCDEEGSKYVDLYGDVCELKDIKHRKKGTNSSDLGLALMLIIIFLLLIVLFFGWRFWIDFN